MGFNSVYRALQEVFPQVDTRMLRAVAIEHSKDADTAVEVVLVEVIPHLSKGTEASDSSGAPVGDVCHPASPEDVLQVGTMNGCTSYGASSSGNQVCVYKGNEELVSVEKYEKGNEKVSPNVTPNVTLNPMVHESSGDDDYNRACVDTECDEMISPHESSSVQVGSDHGSNVSLTTSKHDHSCTDRSMNVNLLDGWECFDGPSASDCIHVESCQAQLYLDDNKLEVENSVVQLAPSVQECKLEGENSVVQLAPPSVQECMSAAPEGCAKLVVSHKASNECEPESNGTSSAVDSKKEITASELVDDEPTLNTVVTRSGQICRIDLLEDIIEDARNNKKTLFSAMESVLSLMKEVELQEKAAEQAKEEAASGGLDILTRVEDLKEMLQHAKEANDMHAGEVYGERAILATEVRELQSRLLCLSDERDKSLAILDEMCLSLEERLDVAEKERKAAEQEKMEKVESARNALAGQEFIMEKVVQESKRLEQEAEENSKLREFLMDRGRVVDMLQGEISVICQDVKFLKEKFDERVPLSKSLSSSQTSCILASSSSSLKSMAPDHVPEQAESFESAKKNSPSPSVDDQLSSGEEKAGTDSKALVDDGWEFFDADV